MEFLLTSHVSRPHFATKIFGREEERKTRDEGRFVDVEERVLHNEELEARRLRWISWLHQ